MKIQKRLAVIALVAALALGFTFPHNANARPDFEKGGPGIELTQEQRDTARKIFDAERAATADTRKALEAKKAELDALMKGDSPDKARIEALSTEIGALEGKLNVSRAKTRAELQKAGLPDFKGGPKGAPKDFGGKDFGKRPDNKDFDGKRQDKRDGKPNLTEEQRAAAKKIIGDSRAATEGLRKELGAKKEALRGLMRSATPDNAKIEALSKEIGQLKGKLFAHSVDTRAKLKEAGLPEGMFRKVFGRDGGPRDGKSAPRGAKGGSGLKND